MDLVLVVWWVLWFSSLNFTNYGFSTYDMHFLLDLVPRPNFRPGGPLNSRAKLSFCHISIFYLLINIILSKNQNVKNKLQGTYTLKVGGPK